MQLLREPRRKKTSKVLARNKILEEKSVASAVLTMVSQTRSTRSKTHGIVHHERTAEMERYVNRSRRLQHQQSKLGLESVYSYALDIKKILPSHKMTFNLSRVTKKDKPEICFFVI